MNVLDSRIATRPCPHCGQQLRNGMIRCRDCGRSIADTEDDAPQLRNRDGLHQGPTCARCGTTLEKGRNDCLSCTSELLDELLKGPAVGPVIPAPHKSPTARPASGGTRGHSVSKSRDAAGHSRARNVSHPTKNASGPTQSVQVTPSRTSVIDQESVDAKDELTKTPIETTAACTALLASLATADVVLRCEIASALGKLGDKAALAPLERFMGDPDIRVRRAVASALAQLGHPKGESLLGIAERTPATMVLKAAQTYTPSRPRSRAGNGLDTATLKKLCGAVLGLAVAAGGIYFAMGEGQPANSKAGRKKAGASRSTGKKVQAKATVQSSAE